MSDHIYEKRGVSASKEDVHRAIGRLDKGIFPGAFCNIYPDLLAGDADYCNVMSSDGSGTKSILAYLYWKETNDISVWRGIAQDALVMNLDDLLCVGSTDHFLFTSIINRNKNLITGEVIKEIIEGGMAFIEKMKANGVNIQYCGGETADLGDSVRTITVDATMSCRMKRSDVIVASNIQAGDVIVGLASSGKAIYEDEPNSGIGSNGLTSARHDLLTHDYMKFKESYDPNTDEAVLYSGGKRMTDILAGTSIGQNLLHPTRTYAPVLSKVHSQLRNKIHGVVHCTGGAQTKVLHFIDKVEVIKNNLFEVPKIFKLIQREAHTPWEEMYKVFNCGHRMEIYLPKEFAQEVVDISKSFEIDAKIIGECREAEKASVKIKSEYGEFNYQK